MVRRRLSPALLDALALLVFVTIGVLTHDASVTAWIRDLLCFELAWFALWKLPLIARWVVAVTAAVAVRALIVGHFAVDFYLVALAFTALFIGGFRLVLHGRRGRSARASTSPRPPAAPEDAR